MTKLSLFAETLIGSEIVKLGNDINERIRKGEKILNYTIGDFNSSIFPIPQELQKLISEGYQNGHTSYPPADGVLELRNAVSAYIKKYAGLEYANNEIMIAAGGRPIIYTAFKTLVDKGDKVIYAVPSWNNNHYTHMVGGEHCMIEATPENNFMPAAKDIAKHIKGAALICLCTPQNPTGTTLRKEELEKICDMVIEENNQRGPNEKKLYVLFDQMYWMLTYDDTKHHCPVSLRPAMKDYTVYVDGMSKSFAGTGIRVGWGVGPAPVLSKMKALLGHIGGWAPMAEQKATAQYLTQFDAIEKFMGKFKDDLYLRLQKIYSGFTTLKEKGYPVDAIAPQAAIYLTVKIDIAGRTINGGNILETQSDVTQYILDKAHLAIVPFSAFGSDHTSPWYRISVGTCKLNDIEETIAKLEEALSGVE